MRIFTAICFLGLLYWPASDALSQASKQHPSSALGHENLRTYQYKNAKYGFTFLLPATWKGCKIIEDTWSGYTETERGEETIERGPAIKIVNPRSERSDQFQDIYIMVFTHKQWDALQDGAFVVGAASIGPGELDRNTKYVFAQPSRMINPDVEGAEEIESIMKGKPLHAF